MENTTYFSYQKLKRKKYNVCFYHWFHSQKKIQLLWVFKGENTPVSNKYTGFINHHGSFSAMCMMLQQKQKKKKKVTVITNFIFLFDYSISKKKKFKINFIILLKGDLHKSLKRCMWNSSYIYTYIYIIVHMIPSLLLLILSLSSASCMMT